MPKKYLLLAPLLFVVIASRGQDISWQGTDAMMIALKDIVFAFAFIGLFYRQYRHKKTYDSTITLKNEEIQRYLNEKEWLLKDIHHRVKNNLQMVISLLNSQSACIDNQPALTAKHNSQHRVHAMTLIHQKLYSADNPSSIEMSAYVRELVSHLADSFDTGRRIRFEVSVDRLEMDVSQAVPLGLMLNEAITNSIKYAFPGDRSGVICISLSSTCPNNYLLVISDNGVGISSHFISEKRGSLGISLMERLSEDLDGHFSIENKNGVTIKISFLHELGAMRDKQYPHHRFDRIRGYDVGVFGVRA